MDLFKTKDMIFTDSDLKDLLKRFNLDGANVLLGSSILSLGRPVNLKCVERIIEIFLEILGREGTLSIPAYSFSGYNNETFDINISKSIVGVLGETARKNPLFKRSIHPIYSHAVWGKHSDMLLKQDYSTCFGKDSYFDILFNIPNTVIIVLGTSLSAMAFYHFYDQLFNAPGRFIKKFHAKINRFDKIEEVEFDSYVKDYENFYIGDIMNCLARFDALATELRILKHLPFAGNSIHLIRESDFRLLYKACLHIDQKYFLCSTKKEWEEYFPKNNFSLFYGKLDTSKINEIRRFIEV